MAYANGMIPVSTLARTKTGHRLRADAAASYDRMDTAFRRDLGYALAITDAYRDLAAQIAVKAIKKDLAAKPGTSVHGLALACDFASGVPNEGSAAHRWMDEHAHEYGWVNPKWAQDYDPRNGAHEPWHWEYVPALDQHDGIGEALLPRPAAKKPAPPTRSEDDDMESFRIRVDAKTNGIANKDASSIYLCRFGPPSTACFRGLTPTENANLDRAGVQLRHVVDGNTERDFSDREKDLMRESIVSVAQKWGVQ